MNPRLDQLLLGGEINRQLAFYMIGDSWEAWEYFAYALLMEKQSNAYEFMEFDAGMWITYLFGGVSLTLESDDDGKLCVYVCTGHRMTELDSWRGLQHEPFQKMMQQFDHMYSNMELYDGPDIVMAYEAAQEMAFVMLNSWILTGQNARLIYETINTNTEEL